MLTVSPDPVRVESQLADGMLVCPSCESGRLAPWGWARARTVAHGTPRARKVRPRRTRCRACKATHVLLSAVMLLRRNQWARVIGRAVELRAAGKTLRPIAAAVGVARSTVRGWLSRFAQVAERLREHFTRWAVLRHPELVRIEPTGSPLGDAVAALAAAAGRSDDCAGRWRFASAATGGRLLCNTTSPFPSPWFG